MRYLDALETRLPPQDLKRSAGRASPSALQLRQSMAPLLPRQPAAICVALRYAAANFVAFPYVTRTSPPPPPPPYNVSWTSTLRLRYKYMIDWFMACTVGRSIQITNGMTWHSLRQPASNDFYGIRQGIVYCRGCNQITRRWIHSSFVFLLFVTHHVLFRPTE
jgi:hypothetical protein